MYELFFFSFLPEKVLEDDDDDDGLLGGVLPYVVYVHTSFEPFARLTQMLEWAGGPNAAQVGQHMGQAHSHHKILASGHYLLEE